MRVLILLSVVMVLCLCGCDGLVCHKRTDPPAQHLDHSGPGWSPVIKAVPGSYGGETLTCTGWRFRSPGNPDLYDMY